MVGPNLADRYKATGMGFQQVPNLVPVPVPMAVPMAKPAGKPLPVQYTSCQENSCPQCAVHLKKCGDLVNSVLHDIEQTRKTLRQKQQGKKAPGFNEENLCAIYKLF